MRRLPDQVEREVGEAEVDLERRRMPAPFAEPLAEDQRIVAEPQQIIDARRIDARSVDRRVERAAVGRGLAACAHLVLLDRREATGHQMCFTTSGMS